MPRPLLHPLALTAFLGLGCSLDLPEDGLSVEPPMPVVHVGERVALQVLSEERLTEDPAWELQEFHGGGFLNSRGSKVTYLAPEGAGMYHVVVRARRFDGAPLRRVVPVQVLPLVRVQPPAVTLPPGGTCTFAARIKGMARAHVSWAIEESEDGTITPEGVFTAPSAPGTYHVLATLGTPPEVTGLAVVRVE